jgi:cell fate regulator YaaT (PSP1 superfamily)
MTNPDTTQQSAVAAIRFTKVGKLYHFDYSTFPDLQPADYVIVNTARGRNMGQVMGFVPSEKADEEHRPILRLATPRDMLLRQQWQARQDEALEICQEKAKQLGGFDEVKFVAARYNYDGSALAFLFTAEQKVNVSKLWDALKREFPAQIEMRQIGPRDVAKLLGGYGACGELRCCSTFLTDFSPISIKMAKTQGISLNPSEITGMCGRLRCCLVYEYEQYVEARKQLPKRNKRVGTPHGIGKVIDVHPLQDSVTVFIEDQGRQLVQREELIPLEEYEAFVKKAQEPCKKENGESCACQTTAAQPVQSQQSPDAPTEGDDAANNEKKSRRQSGKRRSGRRGRRRRSSKKRDNKQSGNQG